MATRSVSSVLKKEDGTAWANATVRFELDRNSYRASPAETYPHHSLLVTTDSSGALSATLISGPGIVYEVTTPDRETFKIAVEDGSAATLEALRASYSAAPVSTNDVQNALNALFPSGIAPIAVQEDDTTKVALATTLDFRDGLNVTESPTGEANIALDFGTGATQPAAGNHTHTLSTTISSQSKTIASGAVTLSAVPANTAIIELTIDTEASAATDDLDTVNVTGTVVAGTLLIITTTVNTRDVVCKHNTGNLVNRPATDFTLATNNDTTMYRRSGSSWVQFVRAT